MPTPEQNYLNPNANYFTAGQGGNPITSDMLSPAPSTLNYSKAGTPTPYPIQNIQVEPPKLDTEQTKAQDLTTRLKTLNDSLVGKSDYKLSQEDTYGLPTLNASYKDTAAQIQALQNESKGLANAANYTIPNTMQENATGRGMTAAGLAPLTASELRKNQIQQGAISSRALTLSSNLAAIQGNIDTANMYVDRAVAQKYGRLEEEYQAKSRNLDLILKSPAYSQAEKDKAAAKQKELDAEKAATDKQKTNEADAQKAVVDILHANPNVDAKTLAALRKATDPISVAQIAQSAGLFTAQTGLPSSAQEYQFAVKNGYKGSYVQYQNEDANRKASIAKAGVGSSGLSTREYTALNQITTRFQADPIINQALRGSTAAAIADQVIANPSSATNQLKSLYILVKNLDPDSAVREGELALANQTQSYLQQWGNTLARINDGRVISPSAAVALATATKELMTAWNATAQSRQQQYTSQANALDIGNDFKSYLDGSNLGYGKTPMLGTQNNSQIITAPDGTQIQIVD